MIVMLVLMTVSLYQTLVMMYQVLYPLLSPPFQEEVPGVLEGNPQQGMERFIPLIPWLTWVHIFNAHVTIVQINNILIFILTVALLVFNHVVVFPYDKRILRLLKEGTEIVTSWDFLSV